MNIYDVTNGELSEALEAIISTQEEMDETMDELRLSIKDGYNKTLERLLNRYFEFDERDEDQALSERIALVNQYR